MRLSHYVVDAWEEPIEPLTILRAAASGEVVAEVGGLRRSMSEVFDHARRVGGSQLRALTFAQRGALLDALSKAVHAQRDALVEASRSGGTTRGDAKFDIDGAAGTLAYYARLGASLGERTTLLDGPAEAILRSKRLVGQHLWVSRRGLALCLNAYNFPCWGLAEKLAQAWLAGLPVLAKPAPATAPLAQAMVQLWVDRGLLPPGALQMIHGVPEGLFEPLGPQDVLAFTGSAATGQALRSHPAVVASGCRVNVEADSLNAAILGPDVEEGTDTWQLMLNETLREMAQKAGQKCTATRRLLVPRSSLAAVEAALGERVASLRVGDPAAKDTEVGPLADEAAGARARARFQELAGGLRIAAQAPAPEGGAWFPPTLLVADTEHAPVHRVEVFGPVCTLLPYDGTAQDAARSVVAAEGALVATLYSDDLHFAEPLLGELAPWHGRILWGSEKVHDQSPGPGVVLPNLQHGGPGRAGGGSELGGLRGVQLYLHRTVVQADRALLARLGWIAAEV